MKYKVYIIFLMFFLLLSESSTAAEIGNIDFIGNTVLSDNYLAEKISAKSNIKKEINYDTIYESLYEILNEYKKLGYYNVRIDSVSASKNRESAVYLKVYMCEGERLKINGIKFYGNNALSENELADIFGVSKRKYFIENEIEKRIEKIIEWYEENGYPFCRINLQNKTITDLNKTEKIHLNINIDEGSLVKLDTVAVEGNEYTKKKLILRESGLKDVTYFDQRVLNDVSRRLNRLEFIALDGKPELVSFGTKSTKNGILLKVIEKSSNYFSGILGYVPQGKNSSKRQINGFVDVVLGNLFGTGRSIAVKWENRGGFSQDFNLKYSEPYLLNLPVNTSTAFNQSVEDSVYLKRDFNAEFKMSLFNNISGYLSFGLENTMSDEFGRAEYNINDSRKLYSKMGFDYDSRDNIYNPRKGIYYSTFYSVGKRKDTKSESELMEHLDKKMSIDFRLSVPTMKNSSIYSRIYGAQVSSSRGDIPYSQLYMLGGANSLRGYKERQFRGSSVCLLNLEYRYLLGEKSRIFLFYDGGYIKKPDSKFYKSGFGWGLRISSKVGLIGIDYGIGEGDSFANGKIHFGVQSNF